MDRSRIISDGADVIFFIESLSDYQHGKALLHEILQEGCSVRILAPQSMSWIVADIRCSDYPNQCTVSLFGSIFSRSLTLGTLKGDVFITSCPDLGSRGFLKSRSVAKYCYFFHSLSSTHTCYSANAFKNFDVVMAAAPHQVSELRYAEQLKKWPPKEIFEIGLFRLDLERKFIREKGNADSSTGILLAPTWGESSFLRCLDSVLGMVRKSFDDQLVLRLHPMTQRQSRAKLDLVKQRCSQYGVKIVDDAKHYFGDSKYKAVVSDWSGVATEFSFSTLRPSIFIDTPQKIVNRNTDIPLPAFEKEIREEIGIVVKDMSSEALEARLVEFSALQIQNSAKANVFNLDNSVKSAIRVLKEMVR